MTLFGSNKHSTTTGHQPMAAGANPTYQGAGTAPTSNDPTYNGTGTGAVGSGVGATRHGYGDQSNLAEHGVGHNVTHGPGKGAGANDPFGDTGVGSYSVPPSAVLNTTDQHRSGGTHSSLTGKAERVIGTLVGSRSLKEKGLQKELNATGLKVQGQELAEAERLEREALLRRERAVAHGAHPQHKHLGGPAHNAAGLTNVPGGHIQQGARSDNPY